MHLRDDERGQAIQVGAVLLFAILIVAFSTYQAVIIPADNRRVEFNHNQEVQEQLADLRNAVLSAAGADGPQSVTVALGTQYPSRTLGLNPNSPGGSLRTVGTTDPLVNLTIENAVATNDETDDFWNGDAVPYETGAIRYSPSYNQYDEAPTTTYEHSVLYNRFSAGNTLVLANQTMIDGNRISIVTLNGSLDRTSSRSTSVDVRPISSSRETVSLEPAGTNDPITISFTSLRDEDAWNRTIPNDADVTVDESTSPAGSEYHRIRLTLTGDGPYHLGMTKAAVGHGATDTDEAYLTTVDADSSVRRGENATITLAARDAYNNPVSGVDVGSSFAGSKTTGGDGHVTFEYDSSGISPGQKQLDFTMGQTSVPSGGSFDSGSPESVSVTLDVNPSGGGGAYVLEWTNPENETANSGPGLSACDEDRCTWDVGDSGDATLSLNATLQPAFENVDLSFKGNDSSVATVSPSSGTTGSDGAAMTGLEANGNGTVAVLAAGNGVSDIITVEVTNVTDGGGTAPTLRSLHEDISNRNENQGNHLVSYELLNPPTDFDKVAVYFVNTDSSSATGWSNSTSTGDTVTHQTGGTAGDSYDIEVTAYDTGGNVIDSWTVSDTADGVNTGASDDLGDTSSPSFTSYTISDDSNNGMQYSVSYTAGSAGFNRVEGYLTAQNPQAGEDSSTWTAPTDGGDLGTYGFSNQEARDMKTSLLLYDDRGVVVDRVTWVDGADGSDSTSG